MSKRIDRDHQYVLHTRKHVRKVSVFVLYSSRTVSVSNLTGLKSTQNLSSLQILRPATPKNNLDVKPIHLCEGVHVKPRPNILHTPS